MERNSSLRLPMLGVLLCFAISNALPSDVNCLRSIKDSLQDPRQILSTWNFSDNTPGFVCSFIGVGCWHDQENNVLEVSLRDGGLRGSFPTGISYCTSIQNLDLSGNDISGPIPINLAYVLPYIVSLDLSNNNLSGPIPSIISSLYFLILLKLDDNHITGQIPPQLSLDRIKVLSVANNSLSGPIPSSIAKCRFLTVLRLDNNQLTGQIPLELSQLDRIVEFSVANNRLSGPVPTFSFSNLTATSYAKNRGLCGGPLSRCKNKDDEDLFLSGFSIGLSVSTTLSMLFMSFYWPTQSISKMRSYLFIIKKLKGVKYHLIPTKIPNQQILFIAENVTEESKITTMEKYVCRMSLAELEMATNDFDYKKVIGFGNMGLMYKATFLNGLTLAVKRLHKFETFEKKFLLEIEILGRLRHANLVPLLGFCYEMEKKFLVYKYMSNGTLHQWLHSRPQVEGRKMGWTLRLRIAVGIARGLAWLHHNNVLRVAHLKMSSNCVLLDDKFEPKISNFGDSNILMNTSGTPSSASNYVVPHSNLDPYKEDVYRFGILLLELVSEEKGQQGFSNEIYEALRIAENCIQTHNDGETSMLQVYQAIRAIGNARNDDFVATYVELF
ncbi:hypothetical protein QVD17_07799 [Tagetes erecta]|uniref:Protein kinase domain-containing protein n=1 Tax=Tagetes erecta TaxID=13708 RepID=A0AAD8P486_TARER|nr:hypothetical protein QVD17_07799 [Tagetes erecta]